MKKAIINFILFSIFLISCTNNSDDRTVQNGDIIFTHFYLNLIDGTRIDESYHLHSKQIKGQPLKFQVGKSQVIEAWDKGVLGMKKGDKKTIEIPPELGYGKKGAYANIKATDTLVLKVELVDWGN